MGEYAAHNIKNKNKYRQGKKSLRVSEEKGLKIRRRKLFVNYVQAP